MTHEQLEKIKEELIKTVKETVNGKIDRMQVQNKEIEKKLDDFMSRSEPVIETFENLNWVKKALIGVAVFVSAVVGMAIAIKKLFNI